MKRNSLMGAMLVVVLVTIVFTPVLSIAAMKVFVDIQGIPGESQDSLHKDWVEAVGYGDSILMPFSIGGGGGGAGKPEFAPIKIIKLLDKASVDLRYYLATGRHIPNVKIEFWTAGEDAKIIYKIELQDVLIGEVSTTWANGSDRPQELVAFYFLKIKWTYTPYKPDGTPLPGITHEYDLERNTGA